MAANETPEPRGGTSALAWIVTITILVLGLLPLVVSSFSQDNTRTSVDGDQSTYSKYVDAE